MARFGSYRPGQFSWIDLLSPDPTASAAFYGALFGWTHEENRDDAGGAYTMFRLGGLDVAGMGGMNREMESAGVPPAWNSYVTVMEIEPALARATELGASVGLPAIDIRSNGELVGRMAVVNDPEGATFSLWQPGRHFGSAMANEPGSFCWNELCSRDPDAAARFYEALFGWTVLPGDDDNGYREIKVGDRLNGGILPWREEMGDFPPSWSVYFSVADCDATIATVESLGGRVWMGPVDLPAGRFAVVSDPLGAMFNVMVVNAPDGSPE